MDPAATEATARRALDDVLDLTLRRGERCILVDSPPGAGKTYLIELTAATAVCHQALKLRVGIAAPQAEQTYEIVRRLRQGPDSINIQILQAEDRELPQDLADMVSNGNLPPPVSQVNELTRGSGVVVGTVAKFFFSQPAFGGRYFDLLICDEAYQVKYADFGPLMDIAEQLLLVGDPGQLPPLSTVATEQFEAARYKVHWAVPKELRRRFPTLPVIQLPATRRLVQDTVDLVQPAHYPELPFASMVRNEDRQLRFDALGMNGSIDRVLDMIAQGASIVGLLLPARETPAGFVDENLSDLMAEISERILLRGARWGDRLLTAEDIGCVDAHVTSVAATQRALRRRGLTTNALNVNTPELWQGLQRPIMLAKHPLSGEPRLGSFNLQPGRWCVMLSRHQLGCIIVGRDGIGEKMETYRHDCSERYFGANDETWAGWNAHQYLWQRLEAMGRLVRA